VFDAYGCEWLQCPACSRGLVETRKARYNHRLAVAQGALHLHIYLTLLDSTNRVTVSG